MLNRIRIQGFKCFQEADIEFSNFTLLAGKNSAGKSTVIQAVLALYQNSASSPFFLPPSWSITHFCQQQYFWRPPMISERRLPIFRVS